jgi:hypothetical protein
MSKILNILEGNEQGFLYYSSKGGTSSPTEFGQKSIPFGMDQQGGGSSAQPYIGNDSLTGGLKQKFDSSIEELTNDSLSLNRASSGLVDAERIGRWLTSPPVNGILFTAKNAALALDQKQQREKALGTFNNPLKSALNFVKNTAVSSVASVANTTQLLPQVAGVGMGLHLNNPVTLDLGKLNYPIKPNDVGEPHPNGFPTYRDGVYKTGDPGKPRLNRLFYNKGIVNNLGFKDNRSTVDQITYTPLYPKNNIKGLNPEDEAEKDLVPFYFEVIDNDNSNDNVFVHLRAFLESITDNFNPQWNPYKLMGRGEDFYTYSGFSREVQFSFKAHAQSRNELRRMYSKLNYLASVNAPDYNRTSGFMRGNLVRLTIGDWFNDVPGIIKSLTFTVQENYPWDIDRDNNGKILGTGGRLPHLVDVQVSFTPIHDFLPEKVSSDYINNQYSGNQNAPFISMGNKTGHTTGVINRIIERTPETQITPEAIEDKDTSKVIQTDDSSGGATNNIDDSSRGATEFSTQ